MPNIAVLSTAHIHTKGFLEALAKGADGRRAYAIWDDVADRGRRYAEQFGAKFVADLGELLRDKAVDGFIVCAENTRHLAILRQALPVGKPVFCEKPLCTTVAEAREIAALERKHGTTLFCGYHMPFGGQMQAIAKMLEAKALGNVTRARVVNAHNAAYGRWFDSPDLAWFARPELSGGGAMMDLGTHAVHLLRTLFGPAAEVWATCGNQSGAYPDVDDFGIMHIRFASGVLGTVEASWTQTGGIGGMEIMGSAKAVWNNGKELVTGAPKQEAASVSPLAARPVQVDRLVAAIQGKMTADELAADLSAILGAVAIMEAAYASSRSGGWVKVEPAEG